MELPFGQKFETHDLAIIGLLVILEGVLSIDNALVLGLLAKRLPKRMQARALTYGLVGAFVFRLIAIGTAAYLLKYSIVKLLGGAYLVYVAVKHFLFDSDGVEKDKLKVGPSGELIAQPDAGAPETAQPSVEKMATVAGTGFWSTVLVIELTDIAFAIDSILAAIALVGAAPEGHSKAASHPKLWVVVTGGMLGVILMRFAAVVFIKLLEKFPRFETSAYLLIIVIGMKLIADWGFNTEEYPHRVDFHNFKSVPFWVFWTLMLICFFIGFIPRRNRQTAGVAG